MQFPNFDPVIFHIGPLAIRWYALAYVAGILLGWRYAVGLVKTLKLWGGQTPVANSEQIDDLILWITLGVIVGGRFGYILFYAPNLVWDDPLEIFQVWKGGMSFHGGFLGVITAVILFARANRMDMFKLGDIVAPAVPIGLFFGRIANFINGELWGRPTALPWGVQFPAAGIEYRHPSQLYEAALEGLVLFFVLRFATHRQLWLQRRGAVTGLFMIGYGVFRIALESVREPDAQMLPFLRNVITMGTLLSIPMLLVGIWLVWRARQDAAPLAAESPQATPVADAAPEQVQD
ncbi:MAG: prolipoprotein diacylglyceryl transferase [Caulobacterales bacterium]|nr:prolipoprotein diacylglyceryl transferase [Caulobacterales bacterium]